MPGRAQLRTGEGANVIMQAAMDEMLGRNTSHLGQRVVLEHQLHGGAGEQHAMHLGAGHQHRPPALRKLRGRGGY